MAESANYQTMLNELEEMVRELSARDVDLDELTTKVRHGYSLIKRMRKRLESTKQSLEKLREQYEGSSEGAWDGDPDEVAIDEK